MEYLFLIDQLGGLRHRRALMERYWWVLFVPLFLYMLLLCVVLLLCINYPNPIDHNIPEYMPIGLLIYHILCSLLYILVLVP